MTLVAVLFSCIFLLALLILVVGLVRPSSLNTDYKGNLQVYTRRRVAKEWGLVAFVSLAVAMCAAPSADQPPATNTTATKAAAEVDAVLDSIIDGPTGRPDVPRGSKEITAIEATLNRDANAFINGWNSVSQHRLEAVEFNDGFVQIEVGNEQILHLSEDKDGDISSGMLLFGSSEPADIMEFLLNMGALIAATRPELSPTDRGDVLRHLRLIGAEADMDFDDEEGARKYAVNGTEYFVTLIPKMAFIFGAEVDPRLVPRSE